MRWTVSKRCRLFQSDWNELNFTCQYAAVVSRGLKELCEMPHGDVLILSLSDRQHIFISFPSSKWMNWCWRLRQEVRAKGGRRQLIGWNVKNGYDFQKVRSLPIILEVKCNFHLVQKHPPPPPPPPNLTLVPLKKELTQLNAPFSFSYSWVTAHFATSLYAA